MEAGLRKVIEEITNLSQEMGMGPHLDDHEAAVREVLDQVETLAVNRGGNLHAVARVLLARIRVDHAMFKNEPKKVGGDPVCRHAWRPIPSWFGRYRCTLCKVVGYRGAVGGGREVGLDTGTIYVYMCQRPDCGHGATHVDRDGRFCPEHNERPSNLTEHRLSQGVDRKALRAARRREAERTGTADTPPSVRVAEDVHVGELHVDAIEVALEEGAVARAAAENLGNPALQLPVANEPPAQNVEGEYGLVIRANERGGIIDGVVGVIPIEEDIDDEDDLDDDEHEEDAFDDAEGNRAIPEAAVSPLPANEPAVAEPVRPVQVPPRASPVSEALAAIIDLLEQERAGYNGRLGQALDLIRGDIPEAAQRLDEHRARFNRRIDRAIEALRGEDPVAIDRRQRKRRRRVMTNIREVTRVLKEAGRPLRIDDVRIRLGFPVGEGVRVNRNLVRAAEAGLVKVIERGVYTYVEPSTGGSSE